MINEDSYSQPQLGWKYGIVVLFASLDFNAKKLMHKSKGFQTFLA